MSAFDAEKYFANRARAIAQEPNGGVMVPPSDPMLNKMREVAQAAEQKKVELLHQLADTLEVTQVRDRDAGEIVSDVGAQFGVGSGNAVRGIGETAKVANEIPQLPGAAGLASLGVEAVRNQINSWLGADKVIDEGSRTIIDAGANAAKYWHDDLSEPRQKALALKQQRIAAAQKRHGELGGLARGFYESLADPENLIEQVPNLALTAAIARRGGAEMAIAGGAALQGGDVAGQTREALDKLPQEHFEQNSPEYNALIAADKSPEEARRIVIDQKVEEAYLAGAAASVVLNKFMPGGDSLERILAGQAVQGVGAKGVAASVLKGSLGEMASEGGEEGSGAFISNERVSTINPEQSLTEGIGAATGLGMGMGLQMGGSMNSLSGAATYAGMKAEQTLAKAAERAAERAALKAATEAGDPTPFLDPATPAYDPAKAIQVLLGANQKEDATPETRAANVQRASEIVEGLETQREELVEAVDNYSPETVQQRLAGYQASLAQAGIDPVKAEKLQQLIALTQEDLDDLNTADPKRQAEHTRRREAVQAELARVNERLVASRALADEMQAAFSPKVTAEGLDVEAEVAAADSADTAVAQPAAQRIITLAMESPEALTPEQANQLASNAGNGLTAQQRAYLRKFSEAQVAANKLKTLSVVSQEIYFGSDTMVGISQYRSRFAQAVARNKDDSALRQVLNLIKFASDHLEKADTARRAMAQHGPQGQIVKVGNQWEVTQGLSKSELRKNGGLQTVSARLVQEIAQEAAALNTAADELQAAYDLAFDVDSSIAEAAPTVAAAPSFVSALDTDEVYAQWSNVRDGSDRAQMRDQMESVARMYQGKVTPENNVEVQRELRQQFKWFRAASPEQRAAAIEALLAKPASAAQTQSTGTSTAVEAQSTQAAPAAPTTQQATVEGPNQSNVDTTVDSGERTQSVVAPGAPVDTQETVEARQKYLSVVARVTSQLLSTASKLHSKTIDEGFLSENTDVAILLDLLGIPVRREPYTRAPSAREVLSAQKRLIELYEIVRADASQLEVLKPEIEQLFGWFASEATTADNADRTARATKSATKYGEGNLPAHYLLQLIEETGELLSEVNRLTPSSSNVSPAQLELQKRALKALRFGENTVNKGEGPYLGKTNRAAFEQAEAAAQAPVEEGAALAKTLSQSRYAASRDKQKTVDGWSRKFAGGVPVRVVEVSRDDPIVVALELVGKYVGQSVKLGDEQFIVLVRDVIPAGNVLGVLAHEFGHTLQRLAFDQADAATQEQLLAAWRADMKAVATDTKAIEAFLSPARIFSKQAIAEEIEAGLAAAKTPEERAAKIAEYKARGLARQTQGIGKDEAHATYVKTFEEWFAEQFSRFVTHDLSRALEPAERSMWESLVSNLKHFFNEVVKSYRPNERFEQWVESLVAPAQASQDWESLVEAAERGEVQAKATPKEAEAKQEEEATDVTEEQDEAVEEEAPTGVLAVFAKRLTDFTGSLAELYTQPGFNPVAQFLTQTKKAVRLKTDRVLVARQDFLSAWERGETFPEEFVEEGLNVPEGTDPFTEKQRNAIENFYTTAREFNARLRANLVLKPESDEDTHVYFRDMLQFLLTPQEDGSVGIEENVLTAMSYSAYRWLLDKANAPAWLTKQQVNKMHGRDKDAAIEGKGYELLAPMTNFEHVVIHELGSAAVQALGLQARKDAPQDILPKLQTAMGVHLLAMLEKAGYIERKPLQVKLVEGFLQGKEGDQDIDGDEETDAREAKNEQVYSYVKLLRTQERQGRRTVWGLPEQTRRIKESNYASEAVIDRLFGSEEEPRIAATKPQKFLQKVAQKTNQLISRRQKKAIQKTMDTPHYLIPEMFAVAELLGRDNLLMVAGAEDPESNKIHITRRKAVGAQRQNLESQYDLMMEMLHNHGLEQAYYVGQSVWRNFRAGFTNHSLNMQTSKIHRALFMRPNWTATIRLDNEELVKEFLVSVAMNLGVKTDQQQNDKSLVKFEGKLEEDPKILEAVQLLREFVVNPPAEGAAVALTPVQQELIRDVAASREGMLSLQALVAYAKYLDAKEKGAESFDVTMLVGADGKTNGPILSHLALGAAGSIDGMYALMNRGGMYSTDAGQPAHYSAYYEGRNAMDLYEDLASKVLERVRSTVRAMDPQAYKQLKFQLIREKRYNEAFSMSSQAEFDAFQTITKPLLDANNKVVSAGRNIVKTPLTGFAFGSALKGSILSMENAFIESIYTAFEEIAKGERKAGGRLEMIRAINTLIAKGNYKLGERQLSEALTIEQLIEGTFTREQEAALREAFQTIMGKSVKEVMNAYFSVFIERRSALNKTIQAAFTLANVSYDEAREAELQRLMESGEIASRIAKNGVRVPLHDLTVAQERALQERFKAMAPVVQTAYSLREGNPDGGIYMAKSKFTKATNTALYQSKVSMARQIVNNQGRSSNHLLGLAMLRTQQSPGVAGTPLLIHSLDSALMHGALLQVEQAQALNVHDEISTSVGYIRSAARAINAQTAKELLHFSPAREALRTFEQLVTNLAQKVKAEEIGAETVGHIFKEWAVVFNRGVPPAEQIQDWESAEALMHQAVGNAFYADKMRLGTIAKMASVDQYTWEGGQFEVTQAIRDEAVALESKLVNEASPAFREAVEFLTTLVTPKETAATEAKEAAAQEDTAEADASPTVTDTVQMGVAGVRAAAVVESIAEQIPSVAEAVAKGMSVVEALNNLPSAERARAIQAISDAGQKIPANVLTPWGLTGTPQGDFDSSLEAALEERGGEMTATEALQWLKKKLDESGVPAMQTFNKALLGQLARTIDSSLKVRLVTATTAADTRLDPKYQPKRNRGWYSLAVDGRSEINLLGSQFAHASLTPELLIHELLHASLAATIDSATGNSNARKLVKELEGLLQQAREKVSTMSSEEQRLYSPALVDVQEFVAWGMSNLAFQKNVLAQIQAESKTLGNKLVDGMRAFIDTLTRIFFPAWEKSTAEMMNTGMSVLISNVSGLFAAAATRPQVKGGINLAQQAPNPIAQAKALTTHQLADALDATGLTSGFLARLDGLLDGIVRELHGANGSFKALLEANVGLSAFDLFQKAQDEGVAPFASAVLAAPFRTPERAAFVIEQVEATVRAALQGNGGETATLYTALTKLYREAHRQLSAKDFHEGTSWANASPAEQQLAQERFDFLFAIQTGADNRSDYLARFAAMGLAHPQVQGLLQRVTLPGTRSLSDGKTFVERLQILFDKVLEVFNRALTHTFPGEQSHAALTTLVTQLVTIEAKKRRKVAKRAGALDWAEASVKRLAEGARNKVAEIATTDFLRQNRFAFVRASSAIAGIWARDQVDHLMNTLDDFRNKHTDALQGLAASLLTEVRGHPAMMQALARMQKNNERHREFIIKQVGKAVLEGFANQGQDLQEEDKAAITQVFLRTDLSALLDTHGLPAIRQFLTHRTSLHNAIQALEGQLAQFARYQHFYSKSAKLLAYYKASGAVRGAHVLMNAGNIARLYGTSVADRVTEEQALAAEKILDQLVSLRALQYLGSDVKAQAAAVFDKEAARADQRNGVELVLRQHRALQEQSKARLFSDSEALMMKGFTPEIFNPNTEFVVADAVEGAELEAMDYRKGGVVRQDVADPDQATKAIYVLKDGGLSRRLTGAISLTGTSAKGTRQHSGFTRMWTDEGAANAGLQAQIATAKQAAIQQMFQPDPSFDPSKVTENFLAPVVNADGKVVNYRYLMQESTKDLVLDRDNRFDKILGTMAGSIFDKEITPVQNRKVIEELKKMYDAEYAAKPHAYKRVSHDSTDPVLREIYRLLPKATKMAIKEVWGREGMQVRVDVLTIAFGYRKASVGDVFDRVEADRESGTQRAGMQARAETALVEFVEGLMRHYAATVLNPLRRVKGETEFDPEKYARRAATVARRNEKIWQEVVAETKDIIVNKTGTVLFFNILSNFSLLAMNGVSLGDMLRHHWIGMKGALAYQKAQAQRFQLQNQLDTGYLTGQAEAAIRREIAGLDDAIARNPVRELIEAGLMPTIVEDIEADDDLYSYKSRLVRKTERFTSKLHPGVVSAGRLAYMAHDTKLYRGLSHLTQLSDFVGRYTLYQHLTSKVEPMSAEEAIHEASESFVNYDIPMPKTMQYLDDVGITMFTKYFLRIQRVLVKLMRDHPARVIGHMLMGHLLFDSMPMVTDSSMLAKFGNNPIHGGAIQFPASLGEIMPVNAGLSLLQ